MRIKHLFVDLNGTILDDWKILYRAIRVIFETSPDLCPSLQDYIRKVANNGKYFDTCRSFGATQTSEEMLSVILETYRAVTKEIAAPFIRETLSILTAQGVTIHVLTSAETSHAKHLFEVAEIASFCKYFYSGKDDKTAALEEVIRELHLQKNECAMIGDLPSDAAHAKRAGITAIAFMNPDVPRDLFSGVEIDFAVLSFDGVIPFVLSDL